MDNIIVIKYLLQPIMLILDSVRRNEHQQLIISLQILAEVIIQIKEDFSQLHSKCT